MRLRGKAWGTHGQSGRKRKEKLIALMYGLSTAQAQALNSLNSVVGHVATQKMPFAKEMYRLLSLGLLRHVIFKNYRNWLSFSK